MNSVQLVSIRNVEGGHWSSVFPDFPDLICPLNLYNNSITIVKSVGDFFLCLCKSLRPCLQTRQKDIVLDSFWKVNTVSLSTVKQCSFEVIVTELLSVFGTRKPLCLRLFQALQRSGYKLAVS